MTGNLTNTLVSMVMFFSGNFDIKHCRNWVEQIG